VCDREEAHLARSFTITLCGITTHTLSFLSYDNSFFFLSLFFFAVSLSRSIFQTTNHNNNRKSTAQMIESDDDEKNRCGQHQHHHRSTTNTTMSFQRRETRTNTKLSNQQFKQAPRLSP
jgi:hypothetical protein